MTRIEGKGVVIDRPVEDVWTFMTDVSNKPKWGDVGEEMKKTSGGPFGAGTTLQLSGSFLGRHVAYDLRIMDFELNKKFTAEFTNGFIRGVKVSYIMEAVEGGKTKLARVTEGKFHGLSKILQPFMSRRARQSNEEDVTKVKLAVEAEGAIPKVAA
jgi:hypothetical protein